MVFSLYQFILLLVALLWMIFNPRSFKSDSYVEKGNEAFKRKDYDSAIIDYDEAIRKMR